VLSVRRAVSTFSRLLAPRRAFCRALERELFRLPRHALRRIGGIPPAPDEVRAGRSCDEESAPSRASKGGEQQIKARTARHLLFSIEGIGMRLLASIHLFACACQRVSHLGP